jgi:hypothetical protein
MNIDNGSSEDLKEGIEVTISANVLISEVGGNYIEVELENGDTITIADGSEWFIEL